MMGLGLFTEFGYTCSTQGKLAELLKISRFTDGSIELVNGVHKTTGGQPPSRSTGMIMGILLWEYTRK